jgi:hypothetical protein
VVFQSIVNGAPPPPRRLRPEIPPGLEQVILRAMNVDPRQRYPSVTSLGRALLPFASGRARLLWTEAFAGVDEPSEESEAPPGGAGTTEPTEIPAVESGGGLGITAKVAGRGPKSAKSADPDGSVPTGTATLDVVSPGRHRAQVKKIGAAVGGLVVALLGGLWLASGNGPDDGGPGNLAAPAADARAWPRGPAPHAPAAPERVMPAASPTPAIPTAAPPPDVTTRPPPAQFIVSVTTDPDDADIELDGELAGVGRLRRSLPADHRRHVLRATAVGFASRVVEFTDRAPQETLVLTALPRPPAESRDEDSPDEAVPVRRAATARPGRRLREGGPDRASRPEPEPLPPPNPNGAPVID